MRPSGLIESIAGAPLNDSASVAPAEGTPVVAANLNAIQDIAVGPDSTVYILVSSFFYSAHILAIGPGASTIHVVAGGGSIAYYRNNGNPEGAPPQEVTLCNATGGCATNFSLGPDGSMYLSEQYGYAANATHSYQVRRIKPVAFPGLGPNQFQIPSANGREVYVFDASGRHLSTLDGLTGSTRYAFAYDVNGRLSSVTDATGNVTTIQRDGSGLPLDITSPYGQVPRSPPTQTGSSRPSRTPTTRARPSRIRAPNRVFPLLEGRRR